MALELTKKLTSGLAKIVAQHNPDAAVLGIEHPLINKLKETAKTFDNNVKTVWDNYIQEERDDGLNTVSITAPTGHILDTDSSLNRLEKKYANVKEELPINKLVMKYETGGRGYDSISSGKGDSGGVSYGTYQLASKKGSLQEFINKYEAAKELRKYKINSVQFKKKWKELAKRDDFKKAQDEYALSSYAKPLIKNLKKYGIDPEKRSSTLKAVLLSTGVQHGGGGGSSILKKVLKRLGPKATDKQIISAIYRERRKRDSKGNLVHFRSNSKEVQESVYKRLVNEERDALRAI